MTEQAKDLHFYLGVLKAKKKYFLGPAIGVFLIAAALAVMLPPKYESSSTILIEEQQIPPEFVRSTESLPHQTLGDYPTA
jgi:succinoglycan biosynthesis transport protein ExoP